MYKPSLLMLFLLSFLCFNCKTISVSKETQTSQIVELGTIGEDKQFILEKDYNATAIPILSQPIKLKMSLEEFNKTSYKAFVKANSNSLKPIELHYNDSVTKTQKFLKLELADRVSVLNVLNNEDNKDIKEYLLNKTGAHVVSAISVVFDEATMKLLMEADGVFLEQEDNKLLVIDAYKNSQKLARFKFSDGVVFAYQASNFCWQEDNTRQLNIVDIVESTDKCPNKTYKSAQRAKKKINYYKF